MPWKIVITLNFGLTTWNNSFYQLTNLKTAGSLANVRSFQPKGKGKLFASFKLNYLLIATDKALFFIRKMLISFLFLDENICCGYSLEAPRRGASNEYTQHMFSSINKKNIMLLPPLIGSSGPPDQFSPYLELRQVVLPNAHKEFNA